MGQSSEMTQPISPRLLHAYNWTSYCGYLSKSDLTLPHKSNTYKLRSWLAKKSQKILIKMPDKSVYKSLNLFLFLCKVRETQYIIYPIFIILLIKGHSISKWNIIKCLEQFSLTVYSNELCSVILPKNPQSFSQLERNEFNNRDRMLSAD